MARICNHIGNVNAFLRNSIVMAKLNGYLCVPMDKIEQYCTNNNYSALWRKTFFFGTPYASGTQKVTPKGNVRMLDKKQYFAKKKKMIYNLFIKTIFSIRFIARGRLRVFANTIIKKCVFN